MGTWAWIDPAGEWHRGFDSRDEAQTDAWEFLANRPGSETCFVLDEATYIYRDYGEMDLGLIREGGSISQNGRSTWEPAKDDLLLAQLREIGYQPDAWPE